MGQETDRLGRDYRSGDAGQREPNSATNPAAGVSPGSLESAPDEVVVIRTQIVETRADMGETIDAIQERLSPQNVKEQVKEQIGEKVREAKDAIRDATVGRVESMAHSVSETFSQAAEAPVEAAKQAGSSIMETVRQNPVPAAMIGVGLGWLLMSGSKRKGDHRHAHDRARTYEYEYAPPYTSGAAVGRERGTTEQGAAGQFSGQAKEKAEQVAGRAREAAGHVSEKVSRGAHWAESKFERSLRERPLAVGAVALAVGAAVGLAIPETRAEDEWMGEARDRLVEKTQSAARDAADKVKHVAQEAGQKLQQ